MQKAFDEMYDGHERVRAHYREYERWLAEQTPEGMRFKRKEADLVFRRVGVTFAVYGEKEQDPATEGQGTERLIPFDVVPRIIPAAEWRKLEAGIKQRVRALNLFLHDVITTRHIFGPGADSAEQNCGIRKYRPEMQGWMSRAASIRTSPALTSCGLRMPITWASTSYSKTPRCLACLLLWNRKDDDAPVFPTYLLGTGWLRSAHYPDVLLEHLRSVAPQGVDNPTFVRTPGMHNSAFSNTRSGPTDGVEMVEGRICSWMMSMSSCGRRVARSASM